ncbi:TPA: hypothetical protein VDV10_006163 [Pseudomonas aeruginosa]|nr:hypothetical protein [Pseudomonas aeruginosa]
MNITIQAVERECDVYDNWYYIAHFSVDAERYLIDLADGSLNPDSCRANGLDSETREAVQEALEAFMQAEEFEADPYSREHAEPLIARLGDATGYRYELDEYSPEMELRRCDDRARHFVKRFRSWGELVVWLNDELVRPDLMLDQDPGPVKRFNANEADRDDH